MAAHAAHGPPGFFAGSGNLGSWISRNHLDTKALLKPWNGFRNSRASGRLTLGRNRTTVRRESAVGAPLPAPTTGPVFPTFRLKIRTRCDASPPGVPPTIQPGEECPQDASLGSHPPSSAPHPSPPGKTSAAPPARADIGPKARIALCPASSTSDSARPMPITSSRH